MLQGPVLDLVLVLQKTDQLVEQFQHHCPIKIVITFDRQNIFTKSKIIIYAYRIRSRTNLLLWLFLHFKEIYLRVKPIDFMSIIIIHSVNNQWVESHKYLKNTNNIHKTIKRTEYLYLIRCYCQELPINIKYNSY